jgi:hypothetical protein
LQTSLKRWWAEPLTIKLIIITIKNPKDSGDSRKIKNPYRYSNLKNENRNLPLRWGIKNKSYASLSFQVPPVSPS